MRLSRQQLAENEAKIRAAMSRLLTGDIPPGGKCDIKTLAREAGVDRTAFYGNRPYAHLREEFERRLRALGQAGEQPDPRDAQITRLKEEVTRLKERHARSAETISELTAFRTHALAASPPNTTRSPACGGRLTKPDQCTDWLRARQELDHAADTVPAAVLTSLPPA